MAHQSELIAEDINEYLAQHERKEMLRLLTCGSVDDGKSTLIGRLLHDTKMIYEDHLAALESDSAKVGTTGEKLDLALLVDGLQAEREQGITIDVAYRYFSTDKRKFIIADTPGHEQYTRNMATGASTAQLAIILIDARHGVLTQTKRHSFIASLLGIRHVVVAINKMDLVDYSEDRYNEIREDYLDFCGNLDLQDIRFVPISALEGDNVVSHSEKTPWFKDQPLMEILETVPIDRDKDLEHLRFPVQYVNRPDLNFRGFCGTVASGAVRPGDTIMALPSRKTTKVKEIVTLDGNLEEAYADQAVTLTLQDEIDISRGDMIVKPDDLPHVDNRIQANVVWMNEQPLVPGRLYYIKQGPLFTSGSVRRIHHKIDVNTLEEQEAEQLDLNEIAVCDFTLSQPVPFDHYPARGATGAFIVIDRLTNVTVGAGMMLWPADDKEDLSEPVSADERKRRFHQEPMVIECRGDSTDLALTALERKLFDLGKTVVVLDSKTIETAEERAKIAAILLEKGLIVLTASLDGVDTDAQIEVATADEVSKATADLVEQLRGEDRL